MNLGWVYLAIALYFIFGTVVALYARRRLGRGMEDFFLANRTLNGIVSALTYSATTYSAFMMVGLAGLTYVGGVGALGFELIYLSGLILAVFFGPRFWLAGKKYGYLTPAELLGDRYGSKTLALVAALASLIFLIPYSAVQLMGIGTLLEGITGGGIPFLTGTIIAAVLAAVWALMGGLRSVAFTDSLQALIMLLASALALFFIVYRFFGGFGGFFQTIELQIPQWLTVPGPGYFNFMAFLGLSLPWFFFSLSNPQVSQRLFVPASLSQMRIMVRGFLVFGFIYTLISVLWGFSGRLLFAELASGDLVTPSLLALPEIPLLISLIVMVGIIAAAISTINSIILTLSSMISRDILKVLKPEVSEEIELLVGKFFIPIFTVILFLFALLRLDLIAVLSVASSAGLAVLVPAIMGAFFWKKGTAAGAITSIVIGGGIAFWFQFGNLKPLGLWPGVWSIIISFALFILVSLFTSPPKAKAEEFLTYLKEATKDKNVI